MTEDLVSCVGTLSNLAAAHWLLHLRALGESENEAEMQTGLCCGPVGC